MGPGDRIRFGNRGSDYRILSTGFDADAQFAYVDFLLTVFSSTGALVDRLPPPPATKSIPTAPFVFDPLVGTTAPQYVRQGPSFTFTIERSPIRATTPALEMPSETVIDLTLSGVGASGTQFIRLNAAGNPVLDALGHPTPLGGPIVIMFTPQGIVEEIYLGNAPQALVSPVFLHIGARDQMPLFADTGGPFNKSDGENYWVMINNANGAVVTASNEINGIIDPTVSTVTAAEIISMRSLARNQLLVGGG